MNTLKKQVEFVLKNYPETRNSDITLMIKLWEVFHHVVGTVQISRLYDLPREDNIKRIRATFQNKLGLYVPTEWEIAKRRGFLEEQWRGFLGYQNRLFF